MIKCPLCKLECKEYKVLVSSHYRHKHVNEIGSDDYKISVLKHNDLPISQCLNCSKLIPLNQKHRKRNYCSRTCYAPKISTHKICSKCKINKEVSNFYQSIRNTGGITSKCIDCHKKPKKEKIIKPKSNLIRFKDRVRSLVSHSISDNGYTKDSRTHQILGIGFEQYRAYLQSKFEQGMTWENYGRNGWTIDHICPCKQAISKEELIKLLKFNNTRPMWHNNNIIKGDRYTQEAEELCRTLLNRDWIGYKDGQIKKDLFLVTGASGSGKSWVLSQLNEDKYQIIDSDKEVKADIVLKCWDSTKTPVLALTTTISTFIKNHSDKFNINLLVIQEDEITIANRLTLRGATITSGVKRRIKRMKSLGLRAEFTGTSQEIAVYLTQVK